MSNYALKVINDHCSKGMTILNTLYTVFLLLLFYLLFSFITKTPQQVPGLKSSTLCVLLVRPLTKCSSQRRASQTTVRLMCLMSISSAVVCCLPVWAVAVACWPYPVGLSAPVGTSSDSPAWSRFVSLSPKTNKTRRHTWTQRHTNYIIYKVKPVIALAKSDELINQNNPIRPTISHQHVIRYALINTIRPDFGYSEFK